MPRVVRRNRDAEEYNNQLIPKDTLVVVGLTEVETSVQTQQRGKFKNRPYDQVKIGHEVLVGEYKGANWSSKYNNNTDRRSAAAADYDPDPYGNSRKWCVLCAAAGATESEDDLITPELDELQSWCEKVFIGKVVAVTVGTWSFKGNDIDPETGEPKKITIQTVKKVEPITDAIRKEFAAEITAFETQMSMSAKSADEGAFGDLGGDDPDEDLPF